MSIHRLMFIGISTAVSTLAFAKEKHITERSVVSHEVIAEQRIKLAENTRDKGFGPQSPRNIDSWDGENGIIFATAPSYTQMNLCSIHFHKNTLDFKDLARLEKVNNLHQALNIPANTGAAVDYSGPTTGPIYNEAGSPLQVTWNVRPNVAKVNIHSVGEWCKSNAFDEDHPHGVRNLVTNPDLLSPTAPKSL